MCAIFTSPFLDNTDKFSPNAHYRRHSPCSLPKMLCSQIYLRKTNLRILWGCQHEQRLWHIPYVSPWALLPMFTCGNWGIGNSPDRPSTALPCPPHSVQSTFPEYPGLDFAIKYLSDNLLLMKRVCSFIKRALNKSPMWILRVQQAGKIGFSGALTVVFH